MKVKLEALVGPCTFFFLEVWSGFVSSPGLVRLSFPRSPAILLGEQVSRPHFWTLLASPAQMPSLVDPIDLGTGSAAQSNIQVYRHQPATHFGSGSEPMHTATQSWMYARAQPDTSKLAPSASVPPPGVCYHRTRNRAQKSPPQGTTLVLKSFSRWLSYFTKNYPLATVSARIFGAARSLACVLN